MVGVGGFGVVYRAMWKSQRMIVAVKKIQIIGTESQRLGEKEVSDRNWYKQFASVP